MSKITFRSSLKFDNFFSFTFGTHDPPLDIESRSYRVISNLLFLFQKSRPLRIVPKPSPRRATSMQLRPSSLPPCAPHSSRSSLFWTTRRSLSTEQQYMRLHTRYVTSKTKICVAKIHSRFNLVCANLIFRESTSFSKLMRQLSLSFYFPQVIWSCLVEDSNLFLKYFMEKLTREDPASTFQILRSLIRFIPKLPQQAAFALYNYIIGYIMFYVRHPKEKGQELIGQALATLWMVVHSVQGIMFKDLKQILRKEQVCSFCLIYEINFR